QQAHLVAIPGTVVAVDLEHPRLAPRGSGATPLDDERAAQAGVVLEHADHLDALVGAQALAAAHHDRVAGREALFHRDPVAVRHPQPDVDTLGALLAVDTIDEDAVTANDQ